ncbi:MAG: NAD-dependent epimerase/dehydratase family protein, partial [Candidatus Aminicenantes bacterium]|nr:NAD-dependent epimerase/dehydratase family protein [Candidatus Aminicenantes bacterium]
ATVKGDLADRDILRKGLEGADVLFHCAAALGGSGVPRSEFYRVNAAGVENALRAAREAGVRRIVHFSSAGVLGKVPDGKVADEAYSPNPQNDYDRSKLEGERLALAAAAAGQDVVVVRPGWAYGPGDRRTFKLIRSIARKRFMLVDKGRGRQTPVFIDDLVSGILLCAEKGRSGEVYHLAGDEILTVREMAATIARACGSSVPKTSLPLGPARVAARVLASVFRPFNATAPLTPGKLSFFTDSKPMAVAKARRELGYEPVTDFRAGMDRTADWGRAKGWL